MKRAVLSFALAGLLSISMSAPAEARTHAPSHNDVMHMQLQLQKLGHYTGPVDGVYGPLTKQAMADFQREKHLYINGKATPPSRALLTQTHNSLASAETTRFISMPNDARPIAYFANPWVTKPQYLYNGMVYAAPPAVR